MKLYLIQVITDCIRKGYEDCTSDEWESMLPAGAIISELEHDEDCPYSSCSAYLPDNTYCGCWYTYGHAYVWEPLNGSLIP